MNGNLALNDIGLNTSLLTDQELYELHLRALGLPKKKYGGLMLREYWGSTFRRILTMMDAFFYLFLALGGFNVFLGVWCMLGILLCACNLTIGPLSLSAVIVNCYLDLIPMPEPRAETLHVGSPESIALIADYLTAPVIKAGESYVVRCQGERVPIEGLLAEAVEIEARLCRERDGQEDTSLCQLYDQEVLNAQEAIERLRAKRDEIITRERLAQQELTTIQEQLRDMHVLAHASHQLRVVRNRVIEHTQAEDEERAKNQLVQVCERLDTARECIIGLQSHAVARARAATEVNQLSRAS